MRGAVARSLAALAAAVFRGGARRAAGLGAVVLGVACALLRDTGPAAVGALYVAAVAVSLAVVDIRERRLPNALVLPGYAFVAVGVLWAWLARGSPPWAAAGCAVGVLAVTAALGAGGGIGMGDAKLAGVLAGALAAVAGERGPPGAGSGVVDAVAAGSPGYAGGVGSVVGAVHGIGAVEVADLLVAFDVFGVVRMSAGAAEVPAAPGLPFAALFPAVTALPSFAALPAVAAVVAWLVVSALAAGAVGLAELGAGRSVGAEVPLGPILLAAFGVVVAAVVGAPR